MRPTQETDVSMFQRSNVRCRSPSGMRQRVGTTTVPSGPTASRKPSITVSAPPTTQPMLLSELWNITVSPVRTPT